MSPYNKRNSKFSSKKHFNRGNYRFKRNSPNNRPKSPEIYDFSRNSDIFSPRGAPPQILDKTTKPQPLEIINPNYDFPINYNSVSPHIQYPTLDISRRDLILPYFPDPSRDLSIRYDDFSPRSQNLSRDYYARNYRNANLKDEKLAKSNSPHDFLRKNDFGSPRSRGRNRKNPFRNFPKDTPRREFARNYRSASPRSQGRFNKKPNEGKYEDICVGKKTTQNSKEAPIVKKNRSRKRKRNGDSPRVEMKNRENIKDGTFKKMKPIDDSSRKSINVSSQVQANAGEFPNKANPGGDFSRKFDGDSSQIQGNASEVPSKANPSDDISRKIIGGSSQIQGNASEVPNKANLSDDCSRKFVSVSPQIQGNIIEIPNKPNASEVSAMSSVSHDKFKVRKIDLVRIFPKNCGALSKDSQTVKINPTRDFTKIGDANSPRVEEKNIGNDEDDSVEEVEPSNENKGKITENSKDINSAATGNKFKIRKVNAVRKFPKYCGALAPRITVRRNDENSISCKKEISSASVEKADDSDSKVINDQIENNGSGLKDDVEEVVNDLKADNLEKVVNEPILPMDFEIVTDEPILLNNVEKILEDPISTNAPELSENLKDQALDGKNDVAPIEQKSQFSAKESLEFEEKEDNKEKGYSPIYPSGPELSLIDENCKVPIELLPKNRKFISENGADLVDEDKIISASSVCKRKQVKETIDSFGLILSKLLDDNKISQSGEKEKRNVSFQVHIEAAMRLKKQNKWINTKELLGHVPGIEVGDKFRFRAELVCIGLHRNFQNGIDYLKKKDGKILATSIVASGRYANDAESSDVLFYSGQGGNPAIAKDKQPQDQKLVRGNLALKNSMDAKTPVRVIRKDPKSNLTYYYDGLYLVTNYTHERCKYGKLAFMFQLNRIESDEPNVTKIEKVPFLFEDISLGKEKIPIRAINTVDDEKFPFFNYVTRMTYPESCFSHMDGCDCTDGCSDSEKCKCIAKNGGASVFDDKGSIIVGPKFKRYIYECGSSCKCPSSCKNRVSQYGIRINLEIFKTESMGWGVRSPNYIPAGSFICEYVGELLQDEEAEKRTGEDEYLFDIDSNGYTIDAAKYGNVARFINHSCSPNLYAQHVLYDHNNKKMPHVMFFAVNGIFPFQELTYDYNYKLDTITDKDGNIKRKACSCGSRQCTGRLY